MIDKTTTVTEKKDPLNPDKPADVVDTFVGPKIATRPIMVNLGSVSRKRIKAMKRGTGKLMVDVRAAVELAAADLGQDAEGQTLQPVVVLFKKKVSDKKKRRGGSEGMCPLMCV